MKKRQVVVTINRDGTSSVDAQNFAGQGCLKATEALEVALNGSPASGDDRKKKPDFFATHTGSSKATN